MKEAGLTWTPQPGCYVWDPLGRIGAPSPFPEGIYFILDLKHFLRRLGNLETITTELVWLPTVDQALWLCSEYGVHPDSLGVFDHGRSWLSPDESLLVLYQALLHSLRGASGAYACRTSDLLRSSLEMCGPLDRIEEKGPSLDDDLKGRLKDLFASVRLAVLATRMGEQPYTNLVAFASTVDLRYLLFATTRATRKFSNLSDQPLVSLLVDNRTNDVSDLREAVAVTATGRAGELGVSMCQDMKNLYLEKHPYLEEFISSPSCVFVSVEVDVYYVVRRFQNVTELHLKP